MAATRTQAGACTSCMFNIRSYWYSAKRTLPTLCSTFSVRQCSLLVLFLSVSIIQIDKPCTMFPPAVFAFSLSIFVFVRPVRERKRIIQFYYFLWLTIQDIKLLPSQSHLPPFLELSFFCAYSLASRLSAMPAARISALLSPWYVTIHTQALVFRAIHCSSFIY